ncbi:putative RNA-directed DNA polymerase [Helianthus annuus]|nr:putative RNA-directed DNA polymerase [Helianthus annuus]
MCKVPMSSNNTFLLDIAKTNGTALALVSDESLLWHLRYGHLHEHGLKTLSDNELVTGFPKIRTWSICQGCACGKQTRKPFPTQAWRLSKVLELVHTNVCGPMLTKSLGGNTYFLLFTDDLSRMTWVYFLHTKSEVFHKFKIWKAKVEKESSMKIMSLWSDNSGEYCSREFNDFCDMHGIRRAQTAPYTPEQNGVSEHKNRTIMKMAMSMIHEKQLSKCFWGEAVATTVYLWNRSPTKAVTNVTQYQVWHKQKPFVHHLRVFGSRAYVLTPKQQRKKLDPKSPKRRVVTDVRVV